MIGKVTKDSLAPDSLPPWASSDLPVGQIQLDVITHLFKLKLSEVQGFSQSFWNTYPLGWEAQSLARCFLCTLGRDEDLRWSLSETKRPMVIFDTIIC